MHKMLILLCAVSLTACSNVSQTARASAHQNAAQGWVLLGECGKRYAAMAEIADGQRDDLARWQAWGEVVSELQ